MKQTLNQPNNPDAAENAAETSAENAAEKTAEQPAVQSVPESASETVEPTVYKFRFDRRTIYLSAAYFVVYAVLGVLLYMLYEGGYLSAWFTSFVAALAALMALSIPTRIVVTGDTVEIRCLCDFTELRREEIAAVEAVAAEDMKWHIPLLGGYGFFGYYGHYFDLRRFERVKLYASEWRNFVRITDIYDDSIIVSCRDAEALIAQLTPAQPAPSDVGEE